MRELLYWSTAKLAGFHEVSSRRPTDRAVKAEASLPIGGTASLSFGERPRADESATPGFDDVVRYVSAQTRAHALRPGTCAAAMRLDWMEFAGHFRFGRRLRDLGLVDQGVYTYMSVETEPCSRDDEGACAYVQLILCGSIQHVREHRDAGPTRMGSGSDWLHDLAVALNSEQSLDERPSAGQLLGIGQGDLEFSARSCYSMLTDRLDGPAYLHGHAQVLCNFAPGIRGHRLIVATPLYVEPALRPELGTGLAGRDRRWWQRWLPARR
ncbi:hypothetical protein GCM10009665_56980 [Kitasatospora nipponensis]|uniref:Uncharacterized protein n=1 Tax=Kitasatospora nipponensis TaxID=258049 RepID=A0ABN1WQK8_9ACTN